VKALALAGEDATLAVTELPDPAPSAGELLVRVHAASINPIDVRVSTGRYPWGKYEYPVVPGFDFAGVVETTDDQVTTFNPGDEVLGYWSAKRFHRGTWAERVAIPADGFVVHKPKCLTFDLAAALPLAAATALLCIDAVQPLAGEAVLITGAGGAIGAYAVQLAATAGAIVLATGRREHARRLHELGAAQVIDYINNDVADTVRRMRLAGVGALIDLVNDQPELTRLSTVVRDGGRVASACFAADVEALAKRAITATNVITTHGSADVLTRVVELVQDGALRVGYDERRPLDEVPAAVAEISAGASRKTVIDVAYDAR